MSNSTLSIYIVMKTFKVGSQYDARASVALCNADASIALFTIQRPCALHAERQSKVRGIHARLHRLQHVQCWRTAQTKSYSCCCYCTGTAQEAEEKNRVEKCVGAIHIHFAYAAVCFSRILFGSNITIHLCRPSIDNQTYEPPQQVTPRPSFFPSVPPFFRHVARAWFIAILHSDWFNDRLVERHDAGIEIKSIRASLHERPQCHSVACSQYDAATQRWFEQRDAGSSVVL